MARETAAERRTRETAEREQANQKFRAAAPMRVLKLMAAVTAYNNDVSVAVHFRNDLVLEEDGSITLKLLTVDYGTYFREYEYEMSKFNTAKSEEWELMAMEDYVAEQHKKVREVKEREAKKRELLAKMSPEDRELLGV